MSIPRREGVTSDAVLCEAGLYAVADGVDHGEGSGQVVLDVVRRLLGTRPTHRRVRAALHAGNASLWCRGDGPVDVAATVTLALWRSGRLVLGHVGDSRAYLVRGTAITLLTNDQLDITKKGDGAVRRVGARRAPAGIDIVLPDVRVGDRLLLCTDGLWRVVAPSAFAELLGGAPQHAAVRLRELALTACYEDASAVVVAFDAATPRGLTSSA
jgi:serine/threonine protein phosphatase PrpC